MNIHVNPDQFLDDETEEMDAIFRSYFRSKKKTKQSSIASFVTQSYPGTTSSTATFKWTKYTKNKLHPYHGNQRNIQNRSASSNQRNGQILKKTKLSSIASISTQNSKIPVAIKQNIQKSKIQTKVAGRIRDQTQTYMRPNSKLHNVIYSKKNKKCKLSNIKTKPRLDKTEIDGIVELFSFVIESNLVKRESLTAIARIHANDKKECFNALTDYVRTISKISTPK